MGYAKYSEFSNTNMNKYIKKDLKRRLLVKALEYKRLTLKALRANLSISTKIRFLALTQLSKLRADTALVKIRNRCILTGRSRGVYNYFKISRIMIRDLASKGLLPGVKKAS
jgi:small subunit ribosomal protein S14